MTHQFESSRPCATHRVLPLVFAHFRARVADRLLLEPRGQLRYREPRLAASDVLFQAVVDELVLILLPAEISALCANGRLPPRTRCPYQRLDKAPSSLAQFFHVAEHVDHSVLFDELHVRVDCDEDTRSAASVAIGDDVVRRCVFFETPTLLPAVNNHGTGSARHVAAC